MTLHHGIFQLTYCQNRRMLDTSLTFTATVLINARSSEVWDTVVNPEKIKEYFFGTDTRTTWQTGSPIVFEGEFEGQTYRDKSVVPEAIPAKRQRYKYWSAWSGLPDNKGNYQIVTFTIDSVDDGVRLTLIQEGFADRQKLRHARLMWPGVMDNIKSIAERE